MATYRQIHTHIWDDPVFEELSPNAKLLFIYGFSNKHRNEAGLYVITLKKMAFETGLSIEQAEAAIKEIIGRGRWAYDWDNHVLWVKNALKYQSVGGKTIIAIKKDIETISSPLVAEYKEYWKGLLYPIDTPPIPYPEDTETPPDKDKGNDKDKDIDKGKDKNFSLAIKQLRSRYSPEQLQIIDRYFEILRTTRVSGKLADSVVHGVYEDMNRFNPVIVEYACKTLINNPGNHDKKENYFVGILRNTTLSEAMKGINGRASPGRQSNADVIDAY